MASSMLLQAPQRRRMPQYDVQMLTGLLETRDQKIKQGINCPGNTVPKNERFNLRKWIILLKGNYQSLAVALER